MNISEINRDAVNLKSSLDSIGTDRKIKKYEADIYELKNTIKKS